MKKPESKSVAAETTTETANGKDKGQDFQKDQMNQINELLDYQGAVSKETEGGDEAPLVATKAATNKDIDVKDIVEKVDVKGEAEVDAKTETEVVEDVIDTEDVKVAAETETVAETETAETETVKVDAETTKKEESTQFDLVAEVERLSSELSRVRSENQTVEAAKPIIDAAPQETKQPELAVPALVDLVTDDNLPDTLTADGLNKFGDGIVARANTAVMKVILPAVRDLVVSYSNIARASDKFYIDNADLADKKSYVNNVMNEVAAEKPELKPDIVKLLEVTNKEVRRRLNLPSQQTTTKPAETIITKRKVAAPVNKATTKTRGVPLNAAPEKATGQQAQIDDMISTMS